MKPLDISADWAHIDDQMQAAVRDIRNSDDPEAALIRNMADILVGFKGMNGIVHLNDRELEVAIRVAGAIGSIMVLASPLTSDPAETSSIAQTIVAYALYTNRTGT